MFELRGKRAIVTGGGKGLCRAMAQALHDAGAEVAILGRSDNVFEAAEKIGSTEKPAYAVKGDLEDTDGLHKLYGQCLKKLGGRVDILLNGAGIQFRAPAVTFPEEWWRRIMEVNLNSLFFLSQMAGETMMEQGYGRIINVASMCSFFGSTWVPAYTASKGAVAQLTKALSNEWAGQGVTVNAIAPGYMATKLTDDMKEKNSKQYEEISARIPAGRWGTPEDLQGIAVFLASDAAAYITGAVIPVDGGYLGK